MTPSHECWGQFFSRSHALTAKGAKMSRIRNFHFCLSISPTTNILLSLYTHIRTVYERKGEEGQTISVGHLPNVPLCPNWPFSLSLWGQRIKVSWRDRETAISIFFCQGRSRGLRSEVKMRKTKKIGGKLDKTRSLLCLFFADRKIRREYFFRRFIRPTF